VVEIANKWTIDNLKEVSMKKGFLTGTMAVLMAVLLTASVCFGASYESVTIDNTSGGVPLSAAIYGRATSAFCTLETAQIRFTLDGATAPTAAVGHILEVGQTLTLDNTYKIKNFRGFRTTSTSGALKCFYDP